MFFKVGVQYVVQCYIVLCGFVDLEQCNRVVDQYFVIIVFFFGRVYDKFNDGFKVFLLYVYNIYVCNKLGGVDMLKVLVLVFYFFIIV